MWSSFGNRYVTYHKIHGPELVEEVKALTLRMRHTLSWLEGRGKATLPTSEAPAVPELRVTGGETVPGNISVCVLGAVVAHVCIHVFENRLSGTLLVVLKTSTPTENKKIVLGPGILFKMTIIKTCISNSQDFSLPNSFLHERPRIQEFSLPHFRNGGLRKQIAFCCLRLDCCLTAFKRPGIGWLSVPSSLAWGL
jgi:hypothetical protein